jgi:hypothetical protein
MKRIILAAFLLIGFFADAQSVRTLMGARAAGMGFASIVLADESSLFNNIGAMAEVKNSASFFAYEVRPYLSGANSTAAGILTPVKIGVAGIGLFSFGDDFYREEIATLGYSNKFGMTSLGISANYVQYRAEGFGTRGALTMNFGGLARITPQITVGASITNITQGSLSQDETLPVKFSAGMSLQPVDHFLMVVQVEKDIAYPALLKTGAEYTIHKKIFVRTGFNFNPNAAYFGLGCKTTRLKIDYAFSFSAPLGESHHASAAYIFEKKKKK